RFGLALLICLSISFQSSSALATRPLVEVQEKAINVLAGPPGKSFFAIPAKYLKIYIKNKKAFEPYSLKKKSTPKQQAHLLYHHLCQDKKIKIECKKH